jgi:glycosyltransferase involved in cell wall biosynthesis
MKILTLNYEYPPVGGGGATVTAQLCRHLVQLGHDADVVTMRYGTLPHEETAEGVRIFRVPSYRGRQDMCRTHEMATYLIGARRAALRLCRRHAYDLIHAHFIFPVGPLARWLHQKTQVPYLITCHGSDVPGHNPNRFQLQHKLLLPAWKLQVRSAGALISPSSSLRQRMLAIDPKLKVAVIPNGLDDERFRTDRRRHKQILLCSRLFEFKGFQYVIEAVRDLSLDWPVHIIGDGPYRARLEELAAGSKTPVIFHGWLDRTDAKFIDLFETSSVFVFPSEMENFPTVLLEAMSAGLAVITSTAGGCPEVVGDAALLVEPRNADAIRSQLIGLIESRQKRQTLSAAGVERVRQFSWQTVAQNYLDLYRQLIR